MLYLGAAATGEMRRSARALRTLDHPEPAACRARAEPGVTTVPSVAIRVPTGELQRPARLPAAEHRRGGRREPRCSSAAGASARAREFARSRSWSTASAQPLMAHGMPRGDVFRALHPAIDPSAAAAMASDPDSPEDPLCAATAAASGGWPASTPRDGDGDCELVLRATLEDGGDGVGRARHGSPRTGSPAEPVESTRRTRTAGRSWRSAWPPTSRRLELFRRQLESIRAQTHRNWVCVISDDCSSPERFAAIERGASRATRASSSRARRGGCASTATSSARWRWRPRPRDYVAMADQDDHWHPDKLETLLGALGDAQLVYSDARIVSPDGELLADTYWSRRRNNHTDLSSLLDGQLGDRRGLAVPARAARLRAAVPARASSPTSTTTGSALTAAVARRDRLRRPPALRLRPARRARCWATRPPTACPPLRDRLAQLREDPRERVRRWRLHYFVDCCRLIQFATVLEMRCGDRMSAGQAPRARPLPARRALAARAGRPRAARGAASWWAEPETLGRRARRCFFAFAWRRLLVAAHPRARAPAPAAADRRPPADDAASRPGPHGIRTASRSARWPPRSRRSSSPCATTPRARVNLLIPTIDLEHFFGGYIAKLNLARRLAERGARVRIVTVDPVPAAAARLAAARSSPTAGSTACSTASRWRSGASRRASR